MKLKLKDEVKLEQLEKYGFKDGVFARMLRSGVLYTVVVAQKHRYIQIRFVDACCMSIAGSLQCLIYDLITDGLVEKVDD